MIFRVLTHEDDHNYFLATINKPQTLECIFKYQIIFQAKDCYKIKFDSFDQQN